MSRGTLILTLVAGALVFLVVLVLYLPASWFASRLPPQVQCASLGGSIWHGECLGLDVHGARLGDATWNLSPLAALTGTLSGDVDVRGGALFARTNLRMKLDGGGELTQFDAQLPLDPAISPLFPRNQRGLVVAKFARVVLGAGALPRELVGNVELRGFQEISPRLLELGSYRLSFDGGTNEGGESVGRLEDIGGPFSVDGNVTYAPPNNYVVQGTISGRTPEAQDIVRQISLGAPPDGAGRNPFSFEGSF